MKKTNVVSLVAILRRRSINSALLVVALLLGLVLIGCGHDYDPKQIQVVADGRSQAYPGSLVSPDFLAGPGAKPYFGRLFSPADFQPDHDEVAVVSYKIWKDVFRSQPDLVGSKIQLDGRETLIVGVVEPAFAPSGAGDIWIPRT